MDAYTAYSLIVFILSVCFGFITAKIASDRGVAGSPVAWWIAGTFMGIIALPMALLMKPDAKAVDRMSLDSGETKKCPRCAELVKTEASICRFCNHSFARAGFDASMKPCPACGESVMKEAVRCKHCGHELVRRALRA